MRKVPNYRFKTRSELMLEYGENWQSIPQIGILKSMEYLLGQELDILDVMAYEESRLDEKHMFTLQTEYEGCPERLTMHTEYNWVISHLVITEMEDNEIDTKGDAT